MKLDFIEVAGFRGFRDKVRVDFAAGVTVITGRNGVGKSTLCDAIEFAVSGELEKYRVERSGAETFADYLWWRGAGSPAAHYVKVGFRGVNGMPFSITRTRDNGCDRSLDEIERALCVGSVPDQAVRQLCKTTFIRDEGIAALSLDLTEHERFELVRAALGNSEGAHYGSRAKEVLACANRDVERVAELYEAARNQLNEFLAQLSEAHARVQKAGDVAGALVRLDGVVGSSGGDLAQRVAAAREHLTVARMRIDAHVEALNELASIHARRDQLAASGFDARRSEAADSVSGLRAELATVEAALVIATQHLELAQAADAFAASLTMLVEHGSKVGVTDGHCPLCAAVRTTVEFEAGLALARARVHELGSAVPAANQAFAEAQRAVTGLRQRLAQAEARYATILAEEEELQRADARYRDRVAALNMGPGLRDGLLELETYIGIEHERLVELERAILTVEASHAVEQVTAIEAKVSALREQVGEASDQLSRAQAGAANAKTIEQTVLRATAEIVDERLALISPLLNELYQRLRPHSDWRSIAYSIRGDVRRFLSLKVGDGLNPQFVFSSGQRRAAGLAFLLAVHLSRSWCQWQTLVLDDPVQHIDDFRALNLVEVLAAVREGGRQIVCAVEDGALADLLCRRIGGSAAEAGRRYDIEAGLEGELVTVLAAEIPPLPASVLRLTSVQAVG